MRPVAHSSRAALSGFRIAAPSFVLPGTVAENCRFLAGKVHEVAVVLFQTAGSLAYTECDISAELASLPGVDGAPMRYHIHLPLDLPWEHGELCVLDSVEGLLKITDCLSPHCFVLHPPPTPKMLQTFLQGWMEMGRRPDELLLENTEESDLAEALPIAYEYGCSLCLDLGHLLAFEQHALLEHCGPQVKMLHVYAPGPKPGHKHLSLAHLTSGERDVLYDLLERLDEQTERVLVLEIFDWSAVQESITLLKEWTGGSKL